jgi:hypothetical protein
LQADAGKSNMTGFALIGIGAVVLIVLVAINIPYNRTLTRMTKAEREAFEQEKKADLQVW